MIAPPPIASNNKNNNNTTNNNNNNNKSDSDSDSSDWDDDDDFATRKISINIKPINQVSNQNISSSVDELRATVGTWKSLANINLVKPNSRRHHQSTLHLENIADSKSLSSQQPKNQQQQIEPNILSPSVDKRFTQLSRLPVAFAVQECYKSKLNQPQTASSSEHLIGHVRLAVPPSLADPLSSFYEQDLEFFLDSPRVHGKVQVNGDFVERSKNFKNHESNYFNQSRECFRINMKSVREFARKRNRIDPGSKYFLLPELIQYHIQSGATNGFREMEKNGSEFMQKTETYSEMNPLNVVSHWLCDLNMTKVRIDIVLADHNLNGLSLTPDDVKNLKVSLEMNGGVNSYHSKPDANWNHLNSKLTWSFASLTEFIQKSGSDEINSCLAKFNLDDGPSTPSSVYVQFSIDDRTLTGTKIALLDTNSFCLAKQKYEVKASLTEIR